jgi:hypothetical protein
VFAGYMGCNTQAALAMFAISVGFTGVTVSGSKSSILDFAPKYSGKLLLFFNECLLWFSYILLMHNKIF